jgi:2-phosphosulfolactate phosphatase
VLVGCLLNARACATAAVDLACRLDASLGIVCAGQRGRFAVDDAIAAGFILYDAIEALTSRNEPVELSDSSLAALKLRSGSPDLVAALRESEAGRLVTALGAGDDVELCARLDSSQTVPVMRDGDPIRIERLHA